MGSVILSSGSRDSEVLMRVLIDNRSLDKFIKNHCTFGNLRLMDPNQIPDLVESHRQLIKHYWDLRIEVEQVLGKALGYPWFKDDQENFPGSTEKDGVCIGDHVAETILEEAAQRIMKKPP